MRVADTSFWSRQAHGTLTSNSTLATQDAAIVLKSEISPTEKSGASQVFVAPHSVVTTNGTAIHVASGMALESSIASSNSKRVLTSDGEFPTLEPSIGTIHDLQTAEKIQITWSKDISLPNAALEFARDENFQSILFSQKTEAQSTIAVDFSDRSPGAWFVRLRSGEKVLGLTAFNVVESQTPDQLRRLGRRWLAWRDRGLASTYRVEFSTSENFKVISESFQVRNRELDLTLVTPGPFFVRVSAASINGDDHVSLPIPIQVQPKDEILSAKSELNDPNLRLFARGWKIILAHEEVTRIREGYVILREAELRGVKVFDEIFQDVTEKDHVKRAAILKSVVFELSRDEAFSNPERVRPDSRGELLPPALPLGILYARLRHIESDGTLGAFGPASRLTTWLPAPLPRKATAATRGLGETGPVVLKWDLGTKVPGYEIRLSSNRDFKPETTTMIRTREPFGKISGDIAGDFFWTVTAINEIGQKISVTSEVQEFKKAKAPAVTKLRLANTPKPREPAFVKPTSPTLQLPAEDAVIVGGATAKKYGKLTWDFGSVRNFDVQIATDNDFVHVVEKAKTAKPEFTLQGDLPEGALFWRVRESKNGEWSRSRKFELVYE